MIKFKDFENIEEYNLSLKLLKNLLNDLSFHANAEKDFFSLINLTEEEAIIIDEKTKFLGYKIP